MTSFFAEPSEHYPDHVGGRPYQHFANAHTPSRRPADTFPPNVAHNRFGEYREAFLNLRYRLLNQQL